MASIDVAANLTALRERIAAVCAQSGRPEDDVRLVAISKRIDLDRVAAAVRAGQLDLGENRLPDAVDRQDELRGYEPAAADVRWHFVGHLQRNKANKAAGRFELIHGVHSAELGQRLDRRAGELGVVQPVLLQVNVTAEPQKDGLDEAELAAVAEEVAALPNLELRGLMCMARFGDPEAGLRRTFARLRTLRDQLTDRLGRPLPELSMGMSGDYEAAIAEGATILRIGTAIFGPRTG
ncbi:YggS family pyridoxal phosphate-dependent enzyme [bacterium]|nr:YggS family pyridoxal phosphate-dependent enzyme [bacterium]